MSGRRRTTRDSRRNDAPFIQLGKLSENSIFGDHMLLPSALDVFRMNI